VAGIYNLPVADKSVDILLNIFAPFDESEFGRVLKNKGSIISVSSGAHHLYEFKKLLYDKVYLNDIGNLLKMTPYYHKSPPERIELFLNTVHKLKTTADFVIRIISIA